jgi:hypothetical protein
MEANTEITTYLPITDAIFAKYVLDVKLHEKKDCGAHLR